MEYDNVLTETEDGLLIVTLHWPERHNAMSHRMRVDLLDCVRPRGDRRRGQGHRVHRAWREVVQRGRQYSRAGGADAGLGDGSLGDAEEGPADRRRTPRQADPSRRSTAIASAPVSNSPWGARSASPPTTPCSASRRSRWGRSRAAAGTQRLYRFVGLGWAMQMVLTGQRIDARTAASIGLVTEVVPRAGLLPRAKELARDMGSRAPMAFVAGRDAVLRSTETDLLTGIDYERKLYALCMGTEDAREGMRAFAEKRAPRIQGPLRGSPCTDIAPGSATPRRPISPRLSRTSSTGWCRTG